MATYHVKSTGSDAADGSDSTPWLTVKKGVESSTAGDTVYVHVGTYTGTNNNINDQDHSVPSGSVGNRIIIAGYPGDTVTLQPPVNHEPFHLREAVHSYMTFQDLIFDNINQAANGCTVGADSGYTQTHLLFERCTWKNAPGVGILFGPAALHVPGYCSFLQCLFYNNGTGPDGGIPGNTAYGLYATMSGCFVEYCSVHDNHGWGIQLAGDNNEIHHTRFYNNGNINGAGQTLGTVHGMVVGVGVYGDSSNNLVHDNLFYENRGGLLVYTHSINTKVYHNTFYNNVNDAVDVQYLDGPATFKNNIFWSNGYDGIHSDGGFGTNGVLVQDHNLATDPDFVGGSPVDLHLQDTSDAIGAGVYVSEAPIDFDDLTRTDPPDIGAYLFPVATAYTLSAGSGEYSSSGTATTLVKVPVSSVHTGVLLQARSGIARAGASRAGYFTVNPVLLVNGVDVTTSVQVTSLRVTTVLNDAPDTAAFSIVPGAGVLPTNGQTVVVSLGAWGNPIFSGTVARVTHRRILGQMDTPWVDVEAWDWRQLLNRRTVNRVYRASVSPATISDIVFNLMALDTSGFGVVNVQTSAVVPDIFVCADERVSDLLTRLVHLNGGGGWYIDPWKDLHFFGPGGETGAHAPTPPLVLHNTRSTLLAFAHATDGRDLRNRVIVLGASTRVMVTVPNDLSAVAFFGVPLEEGWMFDDGQVPLQPGVANLGPQVFSYTGGYALASDIMTCTTTADVLAGATSIPVDNNAAFLNFPSFGFFLFGHGWCQDTKDAAQCFFYGAAASSPTTLVAVGLADSSTGYATIPVDIPAGTVLKVMNYLEGVAPASGATGFDEIPIGDAARPRVILNDTVAQAALAAIEGGDGIHEAVLDAPTDGILAARQRGQADLTAFAAATGVPEQTWTTRDMNARVGAQQQTAFTGSDPFTATLTITQVDYDFFETPRPPLRRCTARNVKAPDLADVLTGD